MATESTTKTKSGDNLLDLVKTIVTVVLAVGIIRTLAFEPFNIPSGSMEPTLLVGDYVFVSKYSYGYSTYSLPLYNPPVKGRLFGRVPERGDVAVFRLPRDPSVDYIKRIVGLPGDKIQVINGVLQVNGQPVELKRGEDFVDEVSGHPLQTYGFTETLPNGVSHPVIQQTLNGSGGLDNTPVFEVPEGHVFGMGDNRNNSLDSRVPSGVGFIPLDNLVGRAEFRFFSYDVHVPWWHVWEWPWAIRFSRMFTAVR